VNHQAPVFSPVLSPVFIGATVLSPVRWQVAGEHALVTGTAVCWWRYRCANCHATMLSPVTTLVMPWPRELSRTMKALVNVMGWQ